MRAHGGAEWRCESLDTWQKVGHSSFAFDFHTPDSCWKASSTTGKINCCTSWVAHHWASVSNWPIIGTDQNSIFSILVTGIGIVFGVIADLINWSPSCDETTAATMATTFSSSDSWLHICDNHYYMTSQKWPSCAVVRQSRWQHLLSRLVFNFKKLYIDSDAADSLVCPQHNLSYWPP